jgi:hypothetical protein
MVIGIPVHIWLLLCMSACATIPFVYVVRYLTKSPERHNPTEADDDYGWRTLPRLAGNLIAFALLTAFAVSISTTFPPGTFGPSIPGLIFGLGSTCWFFWAADGLRSGEIEFRGATGNRTDNPWSFRFLIAHHILLGVMCFGMAALGMTVGLPSPS